MFKDYYFLSLDLKLRIWQKGKWKVYSREFCHNTSSRFSQNTWSLSRVPSFLAVHWVWHFKSERPQGPISQYNFPTARFPKKQKDNNRMFQENSENIFTRIWLFIFCFHFAKTFILSQLNLRDGRRIWAVGSKWSQE